MTIGHKYSISQITSTGDKSYLRLQSPRLEGALSGALHDACVPFPKTCGARFCQVGILVTFIQPLNSKGISFRHQNTTPRYVKRLESIGMHNSHYRVGMKLIVHYTYNNFQF